MKAKYVLDIEQMNDVPDDVMWKIIVYAIDYHKWVHIENNTTRELSVNCYRLTLQRFGAQLSTDLRLFRGLCKNAKRSIEKYSRVVYSPLRQSFIMWFPYGNVNW